MSDTADPVLRTTVGDMPLEEVQLAIGDRTWSILHTGAIISFEEEVAFLRGEQTTKRPYGIVVWPSSIALAHELASLPLAGKRILELGAGTGLPGIVAASLGAQVVQTDRQQLTLHVCRQNAERNGVSSIELRTADWTEWTDTARYDLVIGADILYAGDLHPHLRHIFQTNLVDGGTLLLADPFRETSLRLLEALESEGWRVRLDKWSISPPGLEAPPRPVGVFTLTR